MTNIFVGNLSYQTTQEDLQQAFAQYGGVERVNIVTDRDSGQPRGFAFVEMTERRDAETAIALSGEHFHHIEERLAEGLVERSEISIEQALSPRSHRVARGPVSRADAHR